MAPSYSGVWNISTQYQYRSDWPIDNNILPTGSMAVMFLGSNPTQGNPIDFYNIAVASNAIDFGDGVQRHQAPQGAASNATRLLIGGNIDATPGDASNISYITFATKGNAVDFGDLSLGRSTVTSGAGNGRGIFAGGET
jgi:hypothetical protein